MPAETQYVDSSVFLAFVRDEEGRSPIVEVVLDEAARGERRLLTSSIALVEVAFGTESAKGAALDPATLHVIDGLWAGGSPVTAVEASIRVMEEARELARAARLRSRAIQPLDAIHLGTAVLHEADRVLTYEKKETRELWQELIDRPVEEPTVDRPPLL